MQLQSTADQLCEKVTPTVLKVIPIETKMMNFIYAMKIKNAPGILAATYFVSGRAFWYPNFDAYTHGICGVGEQIECKLYLLR